MVIGTLGLAAVFSAEVSTCDAILFMLSTSLSQDLYKRFVNRRRDATRRCCGWPRGGVVGGLGGVLLAMRLPNVIGALAIFYSLLGVSLFVPVVGGLTSAAPARPRRWRRWRPASRRCST